MYNVLEQCNVLMIFTHCAVYCRTIYKEDVSVIKAQTKQQRKKGEKRTHAPSGGLKLQFVHGLVRAVYNIPTFVDLLN